MCRWGCTLNSTTYMCKWCGTRYCKECLKGDFTGLMTQPTKCKKCNQSRCQGQRVEYVPSAKKPEDDDPKGRRGRGRSASPTKSAHGTRGIKSAASRKKSGKKSAKKKKRK